MALYGAAVPWWRVVRADGVLLPGSELRAVEQYRAEGTPLREAGRARPRGTAAARHAPGPMGRRRTDTALRLLTGHQLPPCVPDRSRTEPPVRGTRASRCGPCARWRSVCTTQHRPSPGDPRELLHPVRRRTGHRPARGAGPGAASAPEPARTGWCVRRRDPWIPLPWTHASAPWLTIPAGRCSSSPGPARARPPRSSRPSPSGCAAGGDPERILVLTFSRKAAVELRDRMAARMAGTGARASAPQATTFHSYCYALVRAHQDADLFAEPLRLLSGPEQDLYIRELLAGQLELERRGPRPYRLAGRTARLPDHPRLRRRGARGARPQPGAGPRPGRAGRASPAAPAARTGGRRPGFLAEYLDVLDAQGVLDYAELVHRAVLLAERDEVAARAARGGTTRSTSTSTRTPTRPRCGCCGRWRAAAATWSPSATPTSRSTPSAAPT